MPRDTSFRTKRRDRPREQHPICIWFCHDCGGQGGMSTVIGHCPECHHERCEHCSAEYLRPVHAGYSSSREVLNFSQLGTGNDHSQKLATVGDVTKDTIVPRSYPIRPPNYENRMTAMEPKRSCSPPPILLPALSPESACPIASSPDSVETHTPRSFSCLSTATPRSHETSPKYQYRGNGYESEGVGESEQDEDDRAKEEDDEEDFSVEGYSPDSMRILESRFISLFNHEPSNIADLLGKFQDLMQFEFGVKTVTNSSAETPSSGIGTFDQGSIDSSSMTTPSYSNTSSRSPNLKRGRKRDDEEQKPKRTRRKQLPERDVLHFACPFRKKDPSKYGSLTDERFSSCLAPKIPQLRRIQYHLESTHRTPQCVRCYSLFNDERGLIDHQKEDPCALKSESSKEGINPDEWSSIRALLKAKKTKSEDEKLEYEKQKWFEIFKLLFPDVSLPDNPWNELYMPVSKASITVDHILGSLERHVEERIENRNLERNSAAHLGIQDILASFRRYQEDLATPQGSSRLESPPEHQHTRGLEVSPGTSADLVDAEAEQMSQANATSLEPLQNYDYSYDRAAAMQDFPYYFHADENPRVQQSESQMDASEFQPSSDDILSEMVYDFDYLPNDEIFPADLNFGDYDRPFLDDPGNENHHLFLDQETPSSSLPDLLALENDGTPDLFIEQRLKTKHHGNKLLRQP